MPILPFTEYYVDQAPEARGVYCLFDSGVLINIGHAATSVTLLEPAFR